MRPRRDKEFGLTRTPAVRQTRYSEDIKLIYKGFIKPLERAIDFENNESTFRVLVETFFQVKSRDVFFAKARNDFKLPGMLVSQLDRKKHLIPGAGPRYVKLGDPFIVRTDSNMPNRIDIEYKDSEFQLTAVEYNVIRDYLKEIL